MLASVSFLRTLQFLQENVLVSKECTVNYVEIVEPHVNYLFLFSFVYVYVWYMYMCTHVFMWVGRYVCKCVIVRVHTPG